MAVFYLDRCLRSNIANVGWKHRYWRNLEHTPGWVSVTACSDNAVDKNTDMNNIKTNDPNSTVKICLLADKYSQRKEKFCLGITSSKSQLLFIVQEDYVYTYLKEKNLCMNIHFPLSGASIGFTQEGCENFCQKGAYSKNFSPSPKKLIWTSCFESYIVQTNRFESWILMSVRLLRFSLGYPK